MIKRQIIRFDMNRKCWLLRPSRTRDHNVVGGLLT